MKDAHKTLSHCEFKLKSRKQFAYGSWHYSKLMNYKLTSVFLAFLAA